jgi:hypothetical protein
MIRKPCQNRYESPAFYDLCILHCYESPASYWAFVTNRYELISSRSILQCCYLYREKEFLVTWNIRYFSLRPNYDTPTSRVHTSLYLKVFAWSPEVVILLLVEMESKAVNYFDFLQVNYIIGRINRKSGYELSKIKRGWRLSA